MNLTIVVPVYNEEKTVDQIIRSLLNLKISKVTIDIVVVNDGSTDGTKNILSQHSHNIKLTILHSKKNNGKGAAVVSGIKFAKGDYIIIQDADLEYDPEQIADMVKPIIENKAQVVYGTRLNRMPHLKNEERRMRFLVHYLGNRFLSLLTSLIYGQWITDMETCYKLFPKEAVRNMTIRARGFEFEPEITAKLIKSGYKIFEVPIITKPRGYEEGKKLHTVRDGIKALTALIRFRIIN